MAISCSCDDGDHEWWYIADNDYSKLATSRRQHCVSCRTLIDIGAIVLRMCNERGTVNEIEEAIYQGENIQLADTFLCETCADLFFSITEAGYCISIEPGVPISDMIKEELL